MKFNQYLYNKSNLLFLIQDTMENIIGGYLSERIINKNDLFSDSSETCTIHDSNAFLFSIKENELEKYPIKQEMSKYAFLLNNEYLFSFGKGNDICVYNKTTKRKIKTREGSYQYDGEIKSVSGKDYITMKRFCIIQMIKKENEFSIEEMIQLILNDENEMKSKTSKNNCVIC